MFDMGNLTAIQNATTIAIQQQHRLSDTIKAGNGPDDRQDDPKLRSACQGMESLFIDYLLKQMRTTVDKSGFISGGQAEEIFTSMLDTELAKEASTRGGIGLADVLYNQLKKFGEAQPGEAENI